MIIGGVNPYILIKKQKWSQPHKFKIKKGKEKKS